MNRVAGSFCSLLMLAAGAVLTPASAQDTLTVAIGQIDNWENQMPSLGQDAGFFRKRGLVLKTFGTQGTEQTLRSVLSGEADIGVAVSTAAAMRAFADGAPVRVLLPGFTGTGDLYWYVLGDSPIRSLKDADEKRTLAFSVPGSSSHLLALGLADQLGVKARPVSTGGQQSTFDAVKSRTVDIGWGAPPFGLNAIETGEIRMIARGSEVPTSRDQTVRVTVVNAHALAGKRAAIERFARAWRETLEWMYRDPKALELYAAKTGLPLRLIAYSRDEFHPKQAMQAERISNAEQIMSDAVAVKILKAPLNRDQLMQFFPEPEIGK